jgi:hypothetical protein
MEEMPIVTRRRIEAAFAKGIFDEMTATFGEEAARAVLARAVVKMAHEVAGEMAARAPAGPSLEHFRAIQSLWRAEDALTIEEIPASEGEFHFNVTRCRYAEMYHAMGLGEIGALLSCNREGAFCEGYVPRLMLTLKQKFIHGSSYCDFRYRWDEGS